MNYSIVSETNCVSLNEVKLYIRIDNNSEDTLLTSLIGAAQNHCREVTGRTPYSSVIETTYSTWSNLQLPFSTAASVVVYYTDTDGNEQTVSSALYTLNDIDSVSTVTFKSTFTNPALSTNTPLPIRVRATYSTSAKENAAFKILVCSLVSYWYSHREPVVVGSTANKLPMTFGVLAASIRTGNFLI